MAKSKKEADRDAALRRIANELSTIGYALPGTLTVRAYACGKANCRCKSDPAARHGPYAYWTRKVGSTTKTRVLTDDQLEDYRQWLDNALLSDIEYRHGGRRKRHSLPARARS